MSINSVGSFGTQTPAAPQGQSAPATAAPAAAPAAAPPQALPRQAPSQEQVQKVLQELKRVIEPVTANNLSFSIDQATGKTLVRVTDADTGEVIRQIPSEELLDIARSLDKLQGLLVRQQA